MEQKRNQWLNISMSLQPFLLKRHVVINITRYYRKKNIIKIILLKHYLMEKHSARVRRVYTLHVKTVRRRSRTGVPRKKRYYTKKTRATYVYI